MGRREVLNGALPYLSWACVIGGMAGLVGCGSAPPNPRAKSPSLPVASPATSADPEPVVPQFPTLPPGPTTQLTLGDYVERLPGPQGDAWLAYAGRPLLLFSPAKINDKQLEIWDLAKGSRLTTLAHGTRSPSWDLSGGRIAVGCSPTRVFETTTGRFLGSYESPRPPPPKPKPRPRRSYSGGLGSGYGRGGGAAYGGSIGGMGIGGLGRSRASKPVRSVASDTCSAFIGSDRLLTIDRRGTHVWSLTTGKRVATAKSPNVPQRSIAADPQGKMVAMLSARKLQTYDARSLKPLADAQLAADSLTFSPDASHLALGAERGLKLVNARSLELEREIELPESFAERPVTYSSDGMTLFTLTKNRLNRVDVASGSVEPPRRLVFEEPISALGTLPERGLIVSASGPRIQFWDAKDGAAKGAWRLDAPVDDFVVLRGGKALVVVGGTKLRLFSLADLNKPEVIKQVELPSAFDKSSRLSASTDGSLVGVPGAGIFRLPGLAPAAQGVTSRPAAFVGNAEVLTASGDEVSITNLQDLGSTFREDTRLGGVERAAWSKLGWVIASADGSVRVMQRDSGELLRSFKAHYTDLQELELSPDGRLLATASRDELRVWDLSTGLAVLAEERSGRLTSLAFTHDSARLLSAGEDLTLSVQVIPELLEEPTPPAADSGKAAQACQREYARVEATREAKRRAAKGRVARGVAGQAGVLNLLSGSGLGELGALSGGAFGSGVLGLGGGKGHYENDQAMSPRKLKKVSWKSVGLGRGFRCGLSTSGLVLCSDGFGSGDPKDKQWGPDDLAVIGVGDAKELAVGLDFGCARQAHGDVRCWGSAVRGDGSGVMDQRPEALKVSLPAKAKRLAAGASHACAALQDGSVWCWGEGGSGQLGNGESKDTSSPVQVCGLEDVEGLALGADFSCAIVGNGEVSCWGGGMAEGRASVPLELEGLTGVQQLAAGTRHVCSLARGRVQCWGEGRHGQLGDGKKTASARPVAVDLRRVGKGKVKQVFAGDDRSCARFEDGSLACWGEGDQGQLGNGAAKSSARPVRVVELKGVKHVATSGARTCAVADGHLRCWGLLSRKWVWDQEPTGLRDYGLGGGPSRVRSPKAPEVSEIWVSSLLPRPAPARRPIFDGAQSLFGTFSGVCALVPAASGGGGELRCSGSEANLESLFTAGKPRTFVKGSSSLNALCLIEQSGQVTCESGYPKKWERVPGVEHTVDVSVGYSKACAVSEDGLVRCWEPRRLDEKKKPKVELVSDVSGARRVAVGEGGEACALTRTNEVYCWGGFDPGLEDDPKPAAATLWRSGVADIAGSDSGVCIALADGKIECHHSRYSERLEPPSFAVDGAKALSLSEKHGCALLSSGEVACWGSNKAGELGRGRVSRPFAAAVSGLPKMKQVVVTREGTCALDEAGQAWCWGVLGE